MRAEPNAPPHIPHSTGAAGGVQPTSGHTGLGAQLPYVVRGMRPWQWSKNGLVLLALVFARRLTDSLSRERALLAFGAFCLAASAIYLLNDIADRDADRRHPTKRARPVAAGLLSVQVALAASIACLLGAAALALALLHLRMPGGADPFRRWGGSPALFVAALAAYVGINIAYSHWLKHQVLWDVFTIAAGFVLRAVAGALAIAVPISPWFYLCTTFLALFLALAKRRAELVALEAEAGAHRRNLQEYSLPLLDQLLSVTVTCTLITYGLYTFQGEGASHALMLTIPFVLFGVFRYLYLVYVKAEGQRPDELLWRDRQILGVVALCALVIVAVLYGLPLLHH